MIRMTRRGALAAVGAVVAAALAVTPAAASRVRPAASAAGPDGVWRTDGYGTIVVIDGRAMRTYDTTSVSCLPGELTGTAVGTGSGRTRRFADDDGTVSTVTTAPGARRAGWHLDADAGDRALVRLPGLPARCAQAVPDTPVETFDVLWHSLAENYPFFARRGIDWRRVYGTYRPRVTAHTTAAQLRGIFADMIEPLHDAHVAVVAGDTVVAGHRPGTTAPTARLDSKAVALVEHADLHHTLHTWCGGRVGYADLPGRLGYLRVSGFTGYTAADTYAANAAALDSALDDIFTTARTRGPGRLRGLVIDLRVNGGGDDPLGLALASRLTGRPFTAYAKRVRNDPRDPDRFTAPRPITVAPGHAPHYTGPLAILTGGSTVSAGETFTQAMLQRSPRPTLVGENTQGVFSDILTRRLPNGWQLFLPDEEYLTPAGTTYDITGIPPDVSVPVLTPGQFAAGRDPAFPLAVSLFGPLPASGTTDR
jgi:Peptidase family S41/Tricorn protease C1 domain